MDGEDASSDAVSETLTANDRFSTTSVTNLCGQEIWRCRNQVLWFQSAVPRLSVKTAAYSPRGEILENELSRRDSRTPDCRAHASLADDRTASLCGKGLPEMASEEKLLGAGAEISDSCRTDLLPRTYRLPPHHCSVFVNFLYSPSSGRRSIVGSGIEQ